MADITDPCAFNSIAEMLSEKDESRRHGCPISENELNSMLTYVEKTLTYKPETKPTWSYDIDTPLYNYIKRLDATAGVLRSRTVIRVPDVSPQALFDVLFTPERRLAFDKFYTRFEVSRVVDENLDVLVSEVEAPLGISNREFVEWRRKSLPDLALPRPEMRYVVYLRSCDSTECSSSVVPKSKKVERAEAWMSGYIAKWWFDDDNKLLGAQLLVISQVDNKGMLPKFVMNTVTSSGPRRWANSIIEAVSKASKSVDIHSSTDEDLERIFRGLLISGTSESELTATSERDLEDSPSVKDIDQQKDDSVLLVYSVGTNLLAFFLTLSIWNTWRSVTYVLSPLPSKFPLRCGLNLGLCLISAAVVLIGRKCRRSNLVVLGNVLGAIALWEFIESLVAYLTSDCHVTEIIIYASSLVLCSVLVFVLATWKNITIIDSSILSPV